MEVVVAFLLALAFVMAIVTVVGHGMWVLIAKIFGGGSQSNTSRPANKPWREIDERPRDKHAALRLLREQLEYFAFWGALDQETRDRLSAAIELEEKRAIELAQSVAAPDASVEDAIELTPIERAGPSSAPMENVDAPSTVAPANTVSGDAPLTRGQAELTGARTPRLAADKVGERARKYTASRATDDVETATLPQESAKPGEPAVPMSRLFAAFMEENNIRWGELVGGLLIVGCSVALVISLWSQIAGRPLLQFVLFNGVTAALFGVGIYTERRWKIHTTSRGLLVIATLLVPLNFLALAAFTQESPPTELLPMAGEAMSLAVFAFLVYVAGRIVTPGDAAPLVVGVMVPSLMQLLVRRFAGPTISTAELYSLAAVPVLAYLASTGLALRRRWSGEMEGSNQPVAKDGAVEALAEPVAPDGEVQAGDGLKQVAVPVAAKRVGDVEANRVLLFLGMVTTAAIMPLALLLYYTPPARETLHWLSPLMTVCGVPALLVGLLFWRRVVGAESPGLQTAGIAIGALGTMVMCAGIYFAWPAPATLLPTAVLTAVAIFVVAFVFGIPAAHVPAAVATAVAALVAFYVARGDVAWITSDGNVVRNALLSATTGYALMPMAAVFSGIAWWLQRTCRDESSLMYGIVTSATAAASLGLAVWFGFGRAGDPHNITWLLAIYALGTLAAGLVLGQFMVTRVGSALLLAALVQGIVFRYGAAWHLAQPWVTALLAHATAVCVSCAALSPRLLGRWHEGSSIAAAKLGDVRRALAWSALVTSTAGAMWTLVTLLPTSAGVLAINLAWVAAIWVLLAVLRQAPSVFTAAQAAASLAIVYAVSSAVESQAWYAASLRPWLDPWFLELVGIALAAFCALVGALRWFAARARNGEQSVIEQTGPRWSSEASRLLNPEWPAVDHVLQVALVLLVATLALYAAAPGVAQELTPLEVAGERVVAPVAQFEIPDISHTRAAGGWAWILLAAAGAALGSGLWQREIRWRVVGLTVVAMAACPLIAARWEADVAVASALRWVSAGFFAVGSIAIGLLRARSSEYDSAVPEQDELTRRRSALESMPISRLVRDLLVAFVVLVYVALGAYVVQAALLRSNVSSDVQTLWSWMLVWAFVVGLAALLVPYPASIQLVADDKRVRVASWARTMRDVLMVLAAAPVLILVTFGVASVLDRHPIVGPDPSAWFRRIGWDVSYGVPLALIAIVFVGHAIRDRSSRFAFAAGALFNGVATMVVLMRLARGGGTLDAGAWIRVAQANAIVAAVVALTWQSAVSWYSQRHPLVGSEPSPSPVRLSSPQASLKGRGIGGWPALLLTQVALAAALCGMFLAPGVANLVVDMPPAAWAGAADGVTGWLAVLLAGAAAIALRWRRRVDDVAAGAFVAGLLAIVSLTVARVDNGGWQAYHTLLVGACVAAFALPVVTWFANCVIGNKFEYEGRVTLRWSTAPARLFGIAAVLLAFRALDGDPQAPTWTIAALLAISLRNVWIAWYEGGRGAMWIASALLILAVGIFWIEWGGRFSATNGFGEALEFVWVNVLAMSAMGVVSVWIERRRAARHPDEAAKRRGIGFHRFAAWAIVALLLLTTGIGLAADYADDSIDFNNVIAWSACAAGLIAAFACLWDPGVRWSVACMYCVGLVAVGIYLDGLNLNTPMFEWALANALAAYSLATSALWSGRDRVRGMLVKFGVPVAELAKPPFDTLRTEQAVEYASAKPIPFSRASANWEGSGHGWLVPANIFIGVFVLLLVTTVQLTDASFTQRMVSAYAIGAQAFAIGLLARGGVRTPLQYTALVWGVLFAIAFGWAWVAPDFPEPLLHRLIVTMASLAAMVIVYGFGLVKFLKRDNEWTRAAAQLVPPLAGIAVVLVVVVVALEGLAFVQRGQVQIAAPAMIVVGVALACLIVAALSAALLPGRDPLGLSERGRTVYVYAAEALAALLFLHIRVTMPWLFRGWFLRFWPLVVMAIAFVGVGLGEVFQRRRQRVLSEPLQTTGALLPLLPALGFWIMSSQVHYSLLLLSIGVLYASMSVLRGSFVYAVLAAIAANGSLWYLLHERQGLSFVEHPQLWLIPPALCALIAGYINRERLTAQQSAALRYAAAIVIYVSSTADVFINGVANAPWLPAVLAGLSIVGVLAGILLRVRAFLYLGTAFLVVAIMTIIWHAAIHQQRTYILWVAGIVTGALIIAMFGLFEKRRDDVLRVVEELKHWHA